MSLRYKLSLTLLALLGVALPLLATRRYGAGVSPDSVGYIATARNLIRGHGFTTYDGSPTVTWPPLYPALLALTGGVTGIDPLNLAGLLNALLFGLMVYAAGTIAHRLLPDAPGLALAATLATLSSSALFGVAVMAWSEPLFILLVILSLIGLDTYLTRRDWRSLLWLSAWVALACMTRYMGVTLILWAAPLILLSAPTGSSSRINSLRQRLVRIAGFGTIAGLPLGLWLLRNYALSHTFFGDRAPSAFTLADNLKLTFKKILEWYLPHVISSRRPLLILAGLGLAGLVALSLWGCWRAHISRLRLAGALFLFGVIYISCLIITSTITANDQIDHRLLSPLFIPLTMLLFALIQAAGQPFRRRFSAGLVQAVLVAAAVIWLVYPVRATLLDAKHMFSNGDGYASKAWMESESVQYLLQHPKLVAQCTIYTNDPAGAYIRARLHAQRSPAKNRYHSKEIVTSLASLQGSWPTQGNACLVWFNELKRSFLFTPGELKTIANLNPIAWLQDGAIFAVSRK